MEGGVLRLGGIRAWRCHRIALNWRIDGFQNGSKDRRRTTVFNQTLCKSAAEVRMARVVHDLEQGEAEATCYYSRRKCNRSRDFPTKQGSPWLAIPSQNPPVIALVVTHAKPTLMRSKEFRGLGIGHPAQIVNIQIAALAVPNPLVSLHRKPVLRTRFGDADLTNVGHAVFVHICRCRDDGSKFNWTNRFTVQAVPSATSQVWWRTPFHKSSASSQAITREHMEGGTT